MRISVLRASRPGDTAVEISILRRGKRSEVKYCDLVLEQEPVHTQRQQRILADLSGCCAGLLHGL